MVVSVTLWAGSAASAGQMPAVMIAAFVLVLFPLTEALLPLGDAIEHIPQYRESLERLQHLEGEEHKPEQSGIEEVNAAARVKEDMTSGVSGSNSVAGQQPGSLERTESASDRRIRLRIPPRLRADIQIDQVSYRYKPDAPFAVQDVSLHLPQGKRLAILGRSGGGKSTLLKLIQGALLPSAGNVLINDLPVQTLGENVPDVIAVLNQSPHLFDTTVANNLRIGRPHATDEEIQRVAAQVGLSDLIESLPQGYDTPMLETGLRFSGGERQRIALARVLLRETPVVIFDEPTVGLDPVTERVLMRTILDSMQGKTMIWVTHHLMGAERMDEVIFMENGQITMQGSHEQLLAREERYRRLLELDRPGWVDGQKPAVPLSSVASR
jgi:ATP-binding cassette subfamily C protein CydC